MEPLEIAEAYFQGWNNHDAEAIARTFAPGGTYTDPTTNGPLCGERISESCTPLFEGFPDVRFEKKAVGLVSPRTVAAQWLMTGTQTGPFSGLPPTGRRVCLPGADFIEVGPEGILSVEGAYDRQIVSDQLGLVTTVTPGSMGPVRLGQAMHLHTGKTQRPGGFSLTRLNIRSKDGGEPPSVWPVFEELATLPGFLSVHGIVMGDTNYTVTAWEKPEDAAGMMRLPSHRRAVQEMYGGTADVDGWTSTWAPERMNSLWVRCTSCWQMADLDKIVGDKCQCGAALPQDALYW